MRLSPQSWRPVCFFPGPSSDHATTTLVIGRAKAGDLRTTRALSVPTSCQRAHLQMTTDWYSSSLSLCRKWGTGYRPYTSSEALMCEKTAYIIATGIENGERPAEQKAKEEKTRGKGSECEGTVTERQRQRDRNCWDRQTYFSLDLGKKEERSGGSRSERPGRPDPILPTPTNVRPKTWESRISMIGFLRCIYFGTWSACS